MARVKRGVTTRSKHKRILRIEMVRVIFHK